MKITEVKTWAVANPPPHHGGPCWVVLRLTTDNGIHGYGEAYGVPFSPRTTCRMIEDVAAQHAVGADPFRIESLWRRVYSRGYAQHPDHALTGVLSGIEIACWDIVGKALDQPFYNLLGGRVSETLRSYTYLYPPGAAAATGARLATKYKFAALLEAQAAAAIQPALSRVGRILGAKKIAGMAEAHYVSIAPHLYYRSRRHPEVASLSDPEAAAPPQGQGVGGPDLASGRAEGLRSEHHRKCISYGKEMTPETNGACGGKLRQDYRGH